MDYANSENEESEGHVCWAQRKSWFQEMVDMRFLQGVMGYGKRS
jgi:hypothetical protein